MKNHLFAFTLAIIGLLASCTKDNAQTTSLELLANKASTWKHLEAIQKIADENQNHRSTGSTGGIATANYIVQQLQSIGLKPIKQPFETKNKSQKKINGQNIIVDIPGKSQNVVMFGAHYDSVKFGPGINDNTTGVAILLELASAIKKFGAQSEKTIRIAFWDAEEEGVLGSLYYAKHLAESDINNLLNYINVDMVGTKEPNILVLDGDNSSFEQLKEQFKENGIDEKEIKNIIEGIKKGIPTPKEGSVQLEELVENYFKSKNIKYKDDLITSLLTDVYPFIPIVPTTGIVMMHEEAQADGTILYAPCYHQACDTIANVDKDSFYIAQGVIFHLADKLAFKP